MFHFKKWGPVDTDGSVRRMFYYRVLDEDGTVRETSDLDEWARNQEARHFVADETIGTLRVVTIFEGIVVVPGDVLLFATAVIESSGRMLSEERHDTHAEAMAYRASVIGSIRGK